MSAPALWTRVDEYFVDALHDEDPSLEAALRESAAGGLPAWHVCAPQGNLLHLLAKMCGARDVREVARTTDATAIQTVGTKGYDGFVIAIVQ